MDTIFKLKRKFSGYLQKRKGDFLLGGDHQVIQSFEITLVETSIHDKKGFGS